MKNANRTTGVLVGCVLLFAVHGVCGQDWPQWRGPNRDNKVAGFAEPKTWPKELTKKWKIKVGLGSSSPALVGDKLYVFTRDGSDEVIRCLEASDGKEVWKDKYAAAPASVPKGGHTGPRSAPVVADGKVCTLGVGGVLSCLDAASGKVAWRKDSKGRPMFYTASSPLIVDGKCVAFLGGRGKGEIVAYDLASGDEKWKWSGDGPPYGSPVLMTVDNTKQIVTLTEGSSLVGVSAADGKLLWKTAYGAEYNSGTPIVDGQTVICSGPPSMRGGGNAKGGTVAFKIEKKGDTFAAKELWKQTKSPAGIYNTPVLRDGLIFGLSSGGGRGGSTTLFCLKADTGDVLWSGASRFGECGAVLDAGSVLLALSTDSQLIAFKPSDKAYSEVAKYKVADSPTWSYPIIAGNRVFVKDQDSLTLWTIE